MQRKNKSFRFFIDMFAVLKDTKVKDHMIKKIKEMSIIQKDDNAQNILGYLYYVEKDYINTHKWFETSANQGNVRSQTFLRQLYYNGQGVKQDHKEAYKWYKMSAEQGDPTAQSNLGYMCKYKLGTDFNTIEQNYQEAYKWYKMSAEQGNHESQNDLGILYEEGLVVKQDYKEAYKWYKLSADQGNYKAQNNIGKLYAYGLGVEKEFKEAFKWYKLSAYQGYSLGQYNTAYFYDEGLVVEQDYKEAYKWYKLSADQGNKDAITAIELMMKDKKTIDVLLNLLLKYDKENNVMKKEIENMQKTIDEYIYAPPSEKGGKKYQEALQSFEEKKRKF
jgi:TPR repeat protein